MSSLIQSQPNATVIMNNLVADIKDFYKSGSVFHIIDSNRFDQDCKRNLFLSKTQVVEKGVRQAIKGAARKFSILWVVNSVLSLFKKNGLAKTMVNAPAMILPLDKANFLSAVVVTPVVEELVFRGLLQNGIEKTQKWARSYFSYPTQKRPLFRALTSRAARIIGTNVPFALAHLAAAPFSAATATQVALMLIYPTYSMLYETTNSLKIPVGAHMANNGAAWISYTLNNSASS